MTWTNQALTAGGVLMVKQAMAGKLIVQAKMSWVGTLRSATKDVKGAFSLSVDGALQNLERALAEDAAREMMESGAT